MKFTNIEHSLPDIPITFYPDHYERRKISIENLSIELPDKEVKIFLSEYATLIGKTYYPGIKFQNKYFTTGTRIYQYTTLTKHIPRQIYYFGRYLRIRYNEEPKDGPDIQLGPGTEPELPRNVAYIQEKTPKLLPSDRPTQQLPNTPNITPDTQQQEEIEAEQETPLHKENINKQKQNQKKIKKTLITYKTQNYKTFRNHNKMVDSEY